MKETERLAVERLKEWETVHSFDPEKLANPWFWTIIYPIGSENIDRLTALLRYQMSETLYKECIKEYKRWKDHCDENSPSLNRWTDWGPL